MCSSLGNRRFEANKPIHDEEEIAKLARELVKKVKINRLNKEKPSNDLPKRDMDEN